MRLFQAVLLGAISAVLAMSGSASAQSLPCHSSIKTGMSRLEVNGLTQPDGGLSVGYKDERFYFPQSTPQNEFSAHKVCMIQINFRPLAVDKQIFADPTRFAKWVQDNRLEKEPTNIAVRVSKPYLDYMHTD